MLDKILAFIADRFSEAPIVVSAVKNMPPNSWTEFATITLKAKRRYLLIGKAGTGNANQATSNASIICKSGTTNIFMEISQGSFTSASGHHVGAFAYIETKTACTVVIRKYNYTSAAYPNGNAMMVAIPVLSGGGTVKVGISMLSTIERWWEHVRQNTGIHCTKIADTDRRGNNECIKLPVLQARKNRYMRFEIPIIIKPNNSMGLCRNVATGIQTAYGYTSAMPLGELCGRKRTDTNQNQWPSKRVCKFKANIFAILDCLRLFSGLITERGCASC